MTTAHKCSLFVLILWSLPLHSQSQEIGSDGVLHQTRASRHKAPATITSDDGLSIIAAALDLHAARRRETDQREAAVAPDRRALDHRAAGGGETRRERQRNRQRAAVHRDQHGEGCDRRQVAAVGERRGKDRREREPPRDPGRDEAPRRDGRQVELRLTRLGVVADDDLPARGRIHRRHDAALRRDDLGRVENALARRDRHDVRRRHPRQQKQRPAGGTHRASTVGTPCQPFKAATSGSTPEGPDVGDEVPRGAGIVPQGSGVGRHGRAVEAAHEGAVEVHGLRAALEARRVAQIGGTDREAIRIAVLPYARAGILGATILGLGRALGETMAVTMVIGNRSELPTARDRGVVGRRRNPRREGRRGRCGREAREEPLHGDDGEPPLPVGQTMEGRHVARDAALQRAQQVVVGRELAARRRAELEYPAREVARERCAVLVDRERRRAVAAAVLAVAPGAGVVVDGGRGVGRHGGPGEDDDEERHQHWKVRTQSRTRGRPRCARRRMDATRRGRG